MRLFWIYIFISLGSLCAQSLIEENGKFYEDGRLFTGKIVEYRDGVVRKEILISKGEIHKNIRFYHSNGKLQEQGGYKKGKKNGLWTVWNKDGQKISEAYYIKGKKIKPGQFGMMQALKDVKCITKKELKSVFGSAGIKNQN